MTVASPGWRSFVTTPSLKARARAPYVSRQGERRMGEAARKLDERSSVIEMRSAPRASAYVCIDVFSDHNFWTGLSMNISEGGVFIATHHHVPIGATVVLHMMLPFEDEAVVTLGEVRWIRDCPANEAGSDAPHAGIGVQFVGISPEALAKVRRFVAAVCEPLFFE
jgi:uncharacterized protein (TIGR02266 family)